MSFYMSSVQKIFGAFLGFLILSACGLKGDLYLPEEQPQVVDTPAKEEANTEYDDLVKETVYSEDGFGVGTEIELTPEEKLQMQKEKSK